MTAWDIFVNGVSLNSGGSGVSDLTGFGGAAQRAYYAQTGYGRDGELGVTGGLEASVIGMTIWVDSRSRDNGEEQATLEDRQAQALSNYAWLMQTLVSDYRLTMSIVVPGSSALTSGQKTRTAQVFLYTDAIPVWNKDRTGATVTVGFKNPDVFWRALGGAPLDVNGFLTLSSAGPGSLDLPTDIYPMNGYIEDAIITVSLTTGDHDLSGVAFNVSNTGSGTTNRPRLAISTPRLTGLMSVGSVLTIDCKAYTAKVTKAGATESVYKFADFTNSRPGSMLRIGPPYRITAGFTPLASGLSVATVAWSIKYRPSFI